ncbi:MAG: response regulator [Saprospiraceae bacterium]|nr:response regulator [Saprospiraceae bacterium]
METNYNTPDQAANTVDSKDLNSKMEVQVANKLLLIEDNPGDARLVELLLMDTEMSDFEITHETTLGDGISRLEEGNEYQAILLDLTLPDSRGFETLEKLLAKFPDNNVIVLTGLSDQTLGVNAVKAGAQDFLVKGAFEADGLAKTLRYSIERRNVLRRLEETQRIAHIGNWEFIPASDEFEASSEVFRLFGLKPRKAIKLKDLLIDPKHPFHQVRAWIDKAMASGMFKDEVEMIKEDGEKRIAFVQIKMQRPTPDTETLYGIIQDITETKKSEELRKAKEVAEQSAKMKERFIASISHEMRTPMNAILGMSNLVIQTDLQPEQYKYIHSIKQSSEILLGIINDILEISTLENGKIIFDDKPFQLNLLLENMINVMQYKATEKQLDFKFEIASNVPNVLIGDKLRLNQVLYNLVGNAVKFTDKGHVIVRVQNRGKEGEKTRLYFEVEDTGIGIPDDKLDAVFGTFTRIRTKDRIFEGTGLGLAISKNIVDQQNGQIGVRSEVGKGSVFYFDIQLAEGDPNFVEEEVKATQVSEVQKQGPLKLLLVEDHKMNQLVARKTLEKKYEGIEIMIADNGKIGCDLLAENDFDIVLMDIQMPVMDGYEAVSFVRNKMPQKNHIPILAMTAHAHISKDEKFKEYGFDDFVLKPFDPDQLFSKIANYVNGNR